MNATEACGPAFSMRGGLLAMSGARSVERGRDVSCRGLKSNECILRKSGRRPIGARCFRRGGDWRSLGGGGRRAGCFDRSRGAFAGTGRNIRSSQRNGWQLHERPTAFGLGAEHEDRRRSWIRGRRLRRHWLHSREGRGVCSRANWIPASVKYPRAARKEMRERVEISGETRKEQRRKRVLR
jgi:hypothetical protein